MNKEQARDLIRRIANHQCIGFSRHCSERMDLRGVSSDDFLHVLMWGKVLSTEFNSVTDQWKCKIKGTDIEGDDLSLHIAIDETEQRVICITVF